MNTDPVATTPSPESPRAGLVRRATPVILLAGIMASVAAVSLNLAEKNAAKEQVYQTVVQKTISDACSPAGPYGRDYRETGLDTTTASHMLLQKPELASQICATINGSLSAAHKKNESVDNTALKALAQSLDVDERTAQLYIFLKDGQNKEKALAANKDAMEMVPATVPGPAFTAPTSMEPNL